MDLGTVTDVVERPDPASWRPGDAWLAGGTSLFSEPRPELRRLLDVTTLGWPPLVASSRMLEIAATCTIAELAAWTPPPEWIAGELIGQCCRAFLGSFKVWNVATVGGNLCRALPAGPMISLLVALEGEGQLWSPDGGERRLPVLDLVLGDGQNALRPGELLRAVRLPAAALGSRTAFAQMSLAPLGRSAALLVGRLAPEGFVLSVTASTVRPVRLPFAGMPSGPELAEALAEAIPPELYLDDVHGHPRWRAHLTGQLAEQVRLELLAEPS